MKKTTARDRLEDATTVADAYRIFDQYVTPRTAGAKQRETTEQVFFAATDWVLGAISRRTVADDGDGAAAADWAVARVEEVTAFARDFARRSGL